MVFIYFLIAFAATLVGSLAGLGGGVIIKPVLDAIGLDNVYTISVLSSATVFSMAVVSTIKQLSSGFKIRKAFIFMVIGASIGGIAGKQLFGYTASGVDPQNAEDHSGGYTYRIAYHCPFQGTTSGLGD